MYHFDLGVKTDSSWENKSFTYFSVDSFSNGLVTTITESSSGDLSGNVGG